MKVFRIFFRSIRDSFKSIFRNFSLSLASILCTTITLILVAVALIVTVNVNHITTELEKELTIVVYANRETSSERIDAIKLEIESMPAVLNVEKKTKEEWRLEMKDYSDTLKATLDYLEENPLLDSLTVKVKDIDDLKVTANKILEIDDVEVADYGEGMVENIISVFSIVQTITIVMVLALVLVTAFLISNTIRLTIFSRRSEIEIMRLVGSSNTAIKTPFVFEGFLLGIIGALIPIIITVYGYYILLDKVSNMAMFDMIHLVPAMPFVLYASVFLLIIGAVVGMFGSARAVRKYLKI